MATGGITFGAQRRRKPTIRPAVVGLGGGVGPKPAPKPSAVTAGGLTQPPFLTYDPGLEAQRRAAQRGLHDTEQDVGTERHYNKTDLVQALKDIRTTTGRKRQDIMRTNARSAQKLSNDEQDVQTKGQRASQDFGTQLENIGRQFAQLGHRQSEGANAAGVLDSGTMSAAAVARGRNQQLAEAPIHVGQERLNEDLLTALQRIGTARGELGQDTETAVGRLGEDRNRERLLTHRQAGRKDISLTRKEQRAKREAAISNADILAQEIYQARESHPGAFTKAGKKKGRR